MLFFEKIFKEASKFINSFFDYLYKSYTGKKENPHLYTIEESYRNSEGKQIIVAKIINTPRGYFKMPATKLILERKDILAGFSIKDIVNIVGLAASEKDPLAIEIRQTPYKYYTLLAMLFGVILVISNILSSKLMVLCGLTITGGQLLFPLTYQLGDVITEVYGYKRARQLIWGAILCNLTFVIFSQITIAMPASAYWHHQQEFSQVLGSVPRIIFASLIGYFCGEFMNSFVLSKMKIAYKGQHFWKRVLGSSTAAISIASVVFTFLAFLGVLPINDLISLMIKVFAICILYEIAALPLTYKAAEILKRIEKIDIYDINTKFNPFSLEVDYSESENFYNKDRNEYFASA